MSTSLTYSDDTGSSSPGTALHLMSETATWLANLSETLSDNHSNISFKSFPEILPNNLSRLPSSPGVVVFCLAFVFFGMSLALFALCTGLVDIDLRLEDKYIHCILFLDGLCDHALKMVDVAGETFLVGPSRIGSGCMHAAVASSKAALHVSSWTFRILDQHLGIPYRYGRSMVNFTYVARRNVQAQTLTICSSSRELAKQLRRAVLRTAHCLTVERARTYIFLGTEWMHARGRSLQAVICAGTIRALAVAVRLPSGRIYSGAWSGAMRPQAGGPVLDIDRADKPDRADGVLTWCVHPSESPSSAQAVDAHSEMWQNAIDAHSEMSLNITLDLDIDENGDLRVALVPEASTQGPTITLRVLCDAKTQTEDQDPGTGDQKVPTGKDATAGGPLAELEGGSERNLKGTNSLALTLCAHRTWSMNSHVPASSSPALTALTQEFNPDALSFPRVHRDSPSNHHIADGPRNSLSDAFLSPLAEEFKVLALSYDAFLSNVLGPDLESGGDCSDDAVLPLRGESGTGLDLSPLPFDALTFAPPTTDSQVAEVGEGVQAEAIVVSG